MKSSTHLYPIVNNYTQASTSKLNAAGGGKLYNTRTNPEEFTQSKPSYRLYNMEDIAELMNDPTYKNCHLVGMVQCAVIHDMRIL